MRRFPEAKLSGALEVTCWGSGNPCREFLHVDDLGSACVYALEHWLPCSGEITYLNVGTGEDLMIRELAELVARVVDFRGAIHWDPSKPDGTPRKQLDVSRLADLGWRAQFNLEQGLRSTYNHFQQQLAQGDLRL